MRPARRLATILLALLPLGLPVVAWAADGVVVNDQQEPIEGARVCYFVDSVELLCNLTDAQGRFELPASETDTIRAHAEGYNPKLFSVVGQQGPVVLKRAPSLMVRLVHGADKKRVEAGKVLIIYPSGKEYGPFPVNRAGLQIRRGLTAGEIRVVGEADGFRKSDPVAVTLEPGEQSDVVIHLVALEKPKQD